MPLRLAVLECDTPQPQTRAIYNSYTGVFSALFAAAGKQLVPPQDLDSLLSISGYDVVNELHTYPALDDIDAVLITGSRHTAYDDDPWIKNLVRFTQKVLDSGRVRVVGICFGHQIVGRALGAPLKQSSNGWEVAVTDVDLTDKGKEIFQLDKMRIQQMHRDIVAHLPADAIPIGSNSFCSVQGMYSPGRYLTVQGHPEFTNEIISEILFNRHTVGIFTDEVYTDGTRRAPAPHDGVAIGKAFLNFMKQG
ncbi:glutamine amidotransferase class-I domain-containing protein [Hirsutella rhossiliensis]|uniref:Glutamine amidotransferase class-I domain-containing protein n=1 Tax=Hirsutella rhossiliensis TaxID=111463 RepID=A0A9P8SFL8_9HYPO|nr:glutamine amidotransferase class-I domain-containing protein [Hirsutella rhossiliensis]KAH0961068.1 glutamine amidotransferase class-I domain-containing protein [Hirsutella rhossiliensis]